MSSVFQVISTDGTTTLTLEPGSQNGGPGTLNPLSDMRLYGMGALRWGEGVNTNTLRLTENFACPQKITGDNLPGYLGGTGPYPNGAYIDGVHPIAPKDETDPDAYDPPGSTDPNDLIWKQGGAGGNGVTTPLTGQSWYNTTSKSLYTWNGVEWVLTGGVSIAPNTTPPADPNDGDLWYDTTVGQLMVYYGGSWESVAERYLTLDGTSSTMQADIDMDNSFRITNLLDPVNPQDAATMKYVDDEIDAILTGGALDPLYVNVAGDTMTGKLTISGVQHAFELTNSSTAYMTIASSGTGSTAPGLRLYNADNDPGAGGTGGPDSWTLLTQRDNDIFNIERSATNPGMSTSTTVLEVTQDGEMIYRGGGVGAANGDIRVPNATFTNPDHVVTKQYVDDALTSAGAAKIWTTLSSTAKAGDIAISGGKIYIDLADGNNWKQVWPAVYS